MNFKHNFSLHTSKQEEAEKQKVEVKLTSASLRLFSYYIELSLSYRCSTVNQHLFYGTICHHIIKVCITKNSPRYLNQANTLKFLQYKTC